MHDFKISNMLCVAYSPLLTCCWRIYTMIKLFLLLKTQKILRLLIWKSKHFVLVSIYILHSIHVMKAVLFVNNNMLFYWHLNMPYMVWECLSKHHSTHPYFPTFDWLQRYKRRISKCTTYMYSFLRPITKAWNKNIR